MIGHMPWLYNKHQSHFIGPLKVDFKKKRSSIINGTRFSQPIYDIPRWKTVTGSFKKIEKNTSVI